MSSPMPTRTAPLLVTLVLSALAGCSTRPVPHFTLGKDVQLPARSVVIFFVDGMDKSRLDTLLADGRLPNIRRHFVEGGVRVQNTIVPLPSITFPSTSSLLTGLLPGHHGIVGNRWFDRRTLQYRKYSHFNELTAVNEHLSAATLYDILADRLTISVHCWTSRGATYAFQNDWLGGYEWLFNWYENVDSRTALRIGQIARIANRTGRWPTVINFYFPGADEAGHEDGPGSDRYAKVLANVDRRIGELMEVMASAGVAEHTCFILLTDHGMSPQSPEKTSDPARWLTDRLGMKIFGRRTKSESYVKRYRRINDSDAVVIEGAWRRMVIHLKGERGWPFAPSVERVQQVVNARGRSDAAAEPGPPDPGEPIALQDWPGVGLVCSRDGPDRVRVTATEGQVLIQRRHTQAGPQYRLQYPDPARDPLGYRALPRLADFVNGQWRGSRQWLAATARTAYPDFVPQIVELFDSPRAGDIVLFARPGWGFEDEQTEHRGGHGSCVARDMNVSIFFKGPGLAPGAGIPCARLVDVMPTALELIGEQERLKHFPPIDGVSIADELKAAGH